MKNINERIRACGIKPAQETQRGWEKTYVFPADFLGFKGHFPENPILPAVIQIMMAREAVTEQIGQEFDVMKLSRAKYMKVITPGIPVTVIWTVKEQPDSVSCNCILETEGNPASKLILTLTKKQG
jgi:3-hydroxyacyl-[acyl-carrier-protein] dehydratase